MHLRNAACRSAHYGTDQSAAAHGPHEFFPHEWAEAIRCPGWTDAEADAMAAVKAIEAYAGEHPAPDEAQLEAHPAILAGIQRLLVPDFASEGAGIQHEITQLFGVTLVAAPLGPGEWRLAAAGGEQQ